MIDLAIYGAGGFGREVEVLIEQINQARKRYNFIGFIDDRIDSKTTPVLGGIDFVNAYRKPISVAVAVATPGLRKSIVIRIANPRVQFPVLIHPSTVLSENRIEFGNGVIITAGCVLTTRIVLGDFVIVNLLSSIGHDSELAEYASVMPGVSISGNVKVGKECLVGTGAKILQNITIGDHAVVGAGAVVTKDVDSNVTVVGVPAKPLKRNVKRI
jgi:sugar O-acyltransferase (sialic acid O-acetyltransferase NeuD family)